MKFPKPSPAIVEWFERAQERVGGDRRQMFGCPCAFVGDQMCCGVFGDEVFVRLGEAERAELLALDGARVFDPMGGRPMREYVVLPADLLDDDEALAWLRRGLAFARSLPPKEGKKVSGRTSGHSGGSRGRSRR